MENNFGIQQHDNFYFGAPPTDFAILGASSSPEFQYETLMTGNPDFGRARASDFGASMADFGAYATDLGVSPSNFESPPLIQPMSSDFPPPMSYHYEAPPPMSTNYGGQTINDSSEQSFMSSQGESFYQDSFYQDSNFGVHQQSNTNFGYSSSRTVLVKIHSELYPISHEVLDWFFSGIGNVESIECFDQCSPFHSRICFQDRDSAVRAFYWLDGSCIYNGCCRVQLILEADIIDRVNEMDASNHQIFEDFRIDEPVRQNPDFSIVNELQDSLEEIEDPSEEDSKVFQLKFHSPKNESSVMDDLKANVSIEVSSPHVIEEIAETSNPLLETEVVCRDNEEPSIEVSESPRNIGRELEAFSESGITLPHLVVDDSEVEIEEVSKEPGIQFEFSKVNSYLPDVVVDELAWEEEELVDDSTAIADFRMKSIACLGNSNAYKVFAEMPRRVVGVFDPGIVVFCVNHNFSYPVCFGPGGVVYEFSWNDIPFDRGKVGDAMMYFFQFVRMLDVCQVENGNLVVKMGSAEVELKIDDTPLSKNSVERSAYKVLEEMPNKKLVLFGLSVCIKDKAMLGVRVETEIAEAMLVASHNKGVQLRIALADEWVSVISEKQGVVIPAYGCIHPIVFDPGGIHCLDGEVGEGRVINLDNSSDQLGCSSVMEAVLCYLMYMRSGKITFPLDMGSASNPSMDVLNVQLGLVEYSCVVDGSVDTYQILGDILIFDPGGMLGSRLIVWNWLIDCGIGCLSMEVQLVSVRHFVFDPGGILFWKCKFLSTYKLLSS